MRKREIEKTRNQEIENTINQDINKSRNRETENSRNRGNRKSRNLEAFYTIPYTPIGARKPSVQSRANPWPSAHPRESSVSFHRVFFHPHLEPQWTPVQSRTVSYSSVPLPLNPSPARTSQNLNQSTLSHPNMTPTYKADAKAEFRSPPDQRAQARNIPCGTIPYSDKPWGCQMGLGKQTQS